MHVEDVVIVGGGAAGVLLVAHIARYAGQPVRLTVVAAGPGRLGSGVAYATDDPDHVLNVRATNLSAWPDEPDHFVSWLARRGTPALPNEYLSRTTYGAYLAAVAFDASNGPMTRVRHVRGRATGIRRAAGTHWEILLADGTTLAAHDVVLAIGVGAPAPIPSARHRIRYVANPWRPGALDAIGQGESALIIGTGLTAIDVVTSLAPGDRRLTAISRHGLIPAAHRTFAPTLMPLETDATDLASLRRHMRARIAASVARTGDWRPAVDGVRPHVQRLWQRFNEPEKRAFLHRDRRRWEVARHRMAPRVASSIAALQVTGQLTITTGDAATEIARAHPNMWIVNATGPDGELRRSADPLLRALFQAGYATPGPCTVGLATSSDGRLLDRSGHTVPGLWTLGCTRRGDLWESTAIPEIRDQADQLARRLSERVPAPILAKG